MAMVDSSMLALESASDHQATAPVVEVPASASDSNQEDTLSSCVAPPPTPPHRILLYLVRWDLRVNDNAILHSLAAASKCGRYSHLQPVYVFNERQVDLCQLAVPPETSCLNPPRTEFGNFPKVGTNQIRFLTEAVFAMKASLERLGSGLSIRVGSLVSVTEGAIAAATARGDGSHVAGVWMAQRAGREESQDESEVQALCEKQGVPFRLWENENTFVDSTAFQHESWLWEVVAEGSPRALLEKLGPLRNVPLVPVPAPAPGTLPPLVEAPPQTGRFVVPADPMALLNALVDPVQEIEEWALGGINTAVEEVADQLDACGEPEQAEAVRTQRKSWSSVGPRGGEDEGWGWLLSLFGNERRQLVANFGAARSIGHGTFLAPYLVHGCLSKRQVAEVLRQYEDGEWAEALGQAEGFGQGVTAKGSDELRKWLVWNDYYHYRFLVQGASMFALYGVQKPGVKHPRDAPLRPRRAAEPQAAGPPDDGAVFAGRNGRALIRFLSQTPEQAHEDQDPEPAAVGKWVWRFMTGTTGMSYVDAAMRQLLVTGHLAQQQRRTVAMYWSQHCGIDWRVGAAYMGSLQRDNDPVVCHGNWQYALDVDAAQATGNRVLHPVQQAMTYDEGLVFTRHWLPELAPLHALRPHEPCLVLQPALTDLALRERAGLQNHLPCTAPVCLVPWVAPRKQDRSPKSKRPSAQPWRAKTGPRSRPGAQPSPPVPIPPPPVPKRPS